MKRDELAAPARCQICGGAMMQRVAPWTSYCASCDYWSAGLKYDIESRSDEIFTGKQDEEAISFLDSIRVRNFTLLLDRARELQHDRPLTILDVGCATGLFLKVAKARGHRVLGLEPNPRMAAGARVQGLEVIEGYFPDALPAGAAFDLIAFNDVFEHIPQLDAILEGARTRLRPGGLLLLNLPSSRGLLFRMGQAAYKMGVTTLWHRLWQTMFYTPHLHYFNANSLDRLVTRFGMTRCAEPIELPTVSIKGLWARVSADRQASLSKRVTTYCAALGVYPLLGLFPKDTFAAFYRAQ